MLKSAGVKDADIRTNELALGYRKIRVVREVDRVDEDIEKNGEVKAEAAADAYAEGPPSVRYAGLLVKRALGVIWVANRIKGSAEMARD